MPVSEIKNIDNIKGMRQFPDKFFDIAFIDAPYGIGMSNIKTIGKKKNANVFTNYRPAIWDNARPKPAFWKEAHRVAKNLIVFGANYFTPFLQPSKGWVFWDKLQPADITFAMGEFIYTSFDIPAQKITISSSVGKNNCSNNPRKVSGMKIHTSQKPIELYGYLMQKFCKPGCKIIVTHLGSGTSRAAAYILGFDFWGFEIDKEMIKDSEKLFEEKAKGIQIIDNVKVEQMRMFA